MAAFEQAIRLDPTYAPAYNNRGGAFYKLKRYDEALAAYEQAIRLDPTCASAFNSKEKLQRILEHEEVYLVKDEENW
jgi:tetratricopeptide (TPR) repeat protein